MGEKRGKKEGEVFRERVSNFSINFPVDRRFHAKQEQEFTLAARASQQDRFCGVSITPGGRVFSYLFYSLAKSPFNGLGYLEAWMAVFSISKDLD